MKKLYMRTTADKLDLPVAVADSPGELARILGTKESVVLSSISHKRSGWHRIEIEEEEEMEQKPHFPTWEDIHERQYNTTSK